MLPCYEFFDILLMPGDDRFHSPTFFPDRNVFPPEERMCFLFEIEHIPARLRNICVVFSWNDDASALISVYEITRRDGNTTYGNRFENPAPT